MVVRPWLIAVTPSYRPGYLRLRGCAIRWHHAPHLEATCKHDG
jgi:hypothetical protein